jgi:hypothetical protein
MRDEFGESLDHLRQGAAHAAGTAAALLEPRLDQVRERLEPTYERSKKKVRGTVRGGSRQAEKLSRRADKIAGRAERIAGRADKLARRATRQQQKKKDARRWPVLVGGLIVAGAAAGVMGAIMARRRQQTWNEYGTTDRDTGLGTDTGRDFSRDTRDTRSLPDPARGTASPVADDVKDKATDVLGQMKGVSEPTGGAATSAPRPGGDFVGNETRNGGSGSRGARP